MVLQPKPQLHIPLQLRLHAQKQTGLRPAGNSLYNCNCALEPEPRNMGRCEARLSQRHLLEEGTIGHAEPPNCNRRKQLSHRAEYHLAERTSHLAHGAACLMEKPSKLAIRFWSAHLCAETIRKQQVQTQYCRTDYCLG